MKNLAWLLAVTPTEGLSQKEWRTKRHSKLEKLSSNDEHRIYTTYDETKEDITSGVTILDWWGKKQTAPVTRKLTEECGGCWITNDQDREKTADGILLDNTRFIRHARLDKTHKKYYRTPDMKNRAPNQYWIFWPREAASKNADNAAELMIGDWDAAFNLTTSYRRDSDIPREFGDYQTELKYARFKKKKESWSERMTPKEHLDDIMNQKSPPDQSYATWLVSNCDNTGGADQRYIYVQRMLEAGLKMDGFGHCFDNVISSRPWTIYMSDHVQWGQFAKYKFYLAFENSIHCPDYMSEKFWRNSIRQGMVPVVSGTHPADVKAMAPPNSFIHVEDFGSPSELVNYLEYLNHNDTAYLEYHAWRLNEPDWSLPTYAQPEEKMICGICHELNERKALGYPKRIIKSVSNWWWVNVHDDQCTAGSILPTQITQMERVSMSGSYDEKDHQRDVM